MHPNERPADLLPPFDPLAARDTPVLSKRDSSRVGMSREPQPGASICLPARTDEKAVAVTSAAAQPVEAGEGGPPPRGGGGRGRSAHPARALCRPAAAPKPAPNP